MKKVVLSSCESARNSNDSTWSYSCSMTANALLVRLKPSLPLVCHEGPFSYRYTLCSRAIAVFNLALEQ